MNDPATSTPATGDDPVRVAIDVGPLHGPRTGIGNAVAWLLDDLEDRRDLDLVPYVTSTRARVVPPQRRLPLPAAAAHRIWAHTAWPPMDRPLGHPAVVHGTNYVVPPARCPRVVSVYDCWFLEHPEEASGDVRRAGAVLRRAVADGAVVVASSGATARRVDALLDPVEVRTIHLGPPPARPAGGLPTGNPDRGLVDRLDGRRFVLSLGTVERRKNLPTLVDAFQRLAGELTDVALVIGGSSGDASPAVAAAIGRLDRRVADRVVRVERVDDASKAWLFDHAAVLAYPSLDEGFGFPILEAQQAGVPVVASDAGSIAEVAGDGAVLVPPGDADELAAGLRSTLDDEARRAALTARGTANLARFSWSATGDAHVALYRELAGR